MKYVYLFLPYLLSASLTAAEAKKSAVVFVPMQHKAMDEIVAGLRSEMTKILPHVELTVAEAHGDMNVMRSLIVQAKHKKADVLLPIGTQATQMTAALAGQTPVVGLATLPFPHQNCMSIVEDEVASREFVAFLVKRFPEFKKIAIVYSSSEKMLPQVQQLEVELLKNKITLQKLMVHAQPDIFNAVKNLGKDTQAVLILKDHLVVSGVSILVQEAKRRNIPLIAADEGSVKNGATLALGVSESDIGRRGAVMMKRMLQSDKQLCQHVESFVGKDLQVFTK